MRVRLAVVLLPLAHQSFDGIHGVALAGPESLVVPSVLADGNREWLSIDAGERLRGSGLKVALLIKDVIEGQEHLLLNEGYLSTREQYCHIANWLANGRFVGQNGANEQSRTARRSGPGGHLVDGLACAIDESSLFEKVGGRVA